VVVLAARGRVVGRRADYKVIVAEGSVEEKKNVMVEKIMRRRLIFG
jgi:hypothetical protein